MAAGAAADKWYYHDFAGLTHLLTGQAIGRRLSAKAATAVAVLHHIAQTNRLENVLHPSAVQMPPGWDLLPDALADRQAWAQIWLSGPERRVGNGRIATLKINCALAGCLRTGPLTAQPDGRDPFAQSGRGAGRHRRAAGPGAAYRAR
ncbi:MAG: hypothetical protein H6661_02625 [Ardenticatenaceae bacterium]|nr:hypothetical protein [Ardenticatenaceae bacterium]